MAESGRPRTASCAAVAAQSRPGLPPEGAVRGALAFAVSPGHPGDLHGREDTGADSHSGH